MGLSSGAAMFKTLHSTLISTLRLDVLSDKRGGPEQAHRAVPPKPHETPFLVQTYTRRRLTGDLPTELVESYPLRRLHKCAHCALVLRLQRAHHFMYPCIFFRVNGFHSFTTSLEPFIPLIFVLHDRVVELIHHRLASRSQEQPNRVLTSFLRPVFLVDRQRNGHHINEVYPATDLIPHTTWIPRGQSLLLNRPLCINLLAVSVDEMANIKVLP